LNMAEWPFSVVPPAGPTGVWVGREDAQRRMRALIRSTGRVGVSQFLLLWADFGAGKTHALRYLEFLARENSHLAPLYVVTPRGVRTFVDLYRAIIDAMHEAGLLQTIGQDIFDRTLKVGVESDLERALIRIPTYNQETAKMALALLRADRVPAAELRELGVSRRLETAADAVNALDQLLGLVRREDRHMLLLLDEMQELADLGRRLPEAVGGLHKVFDRNREGLTMVCSFTTGSQQAVQGIVGDALFDRASVALTLPALDQEAGVELAVGLLRAHSLEPDRCPFPFEPEAVIALVAETAKRTAVLSPRRVIKAFDCVLRVAELDIEDGVIDAVDAAYARAAYLQASPDEEPI